MTDAEEALTSVKHRMNKGERDAPSKARNVRFGELAEQWLDEQTHLRPRTRDAYRWALDRHLLPRFEHRRVASLTAEDATELIAAMRSRKPKPYSGSTMQAVVLPLSQVLSHTRSGAGSSPRTRSTGSTRTSGRRRPNGKALSRSG